MTAITREKIFFPSTFDASLSFKVESLGEIFLNVDSTAHERESSQTWVACAAAIAQSPRPRSDRTQLRSISSSGAHGCETSLPVSNGSEKAIQETRSAECVYIYILTDEKVLWIFPPPSLRFCSAINNIGNIYNIFLRWKREEREIRDGVESSINSIGQSVNNSDSFLSPLRSTNVIRFDFARGKLIVKSRSRPIKTESSSIVQRRRCVKDTVIADGARL